LSAFSAYSEAPVARSTTLIPHVACCARGSCCRIVLMRVARRVPKSCMASGETAGVGGVAGVVCEDCGETAGSGAMAGAVCGD